MGMLQRTFGILKRALRYKEAYVFWGKLQCILERVVTSLEKNSEKSLSIRKRARQFEKEPYVFSIGLSVFSKKAHVF